MRPSAGAGRFSPGRLSAVEAVIDEIVAEIDPVEEAVEGFLRTPDGAGA